MATRVGLWKQEQEEAATSEPHARPTRLSDFILGSQDGLVNVLGVILGVAVASNNLKIILAGGLAATFAESISMAAVAYTSTLARRDHYLNERRREEQEMVELPDVERKEVRDILESWGYRGQDLEDITDRLVANPKAWLEFMMAHELNLAPIERGQARRSAILVGAAAIVGSLVPLAPFAFFGNAVFDGMIVSVIVAGVALFLIGWYKARTTVGRPGRSGLQMLLIGISSALAGFAIAALVGAVG